MVGISLYKGAVTVDLVENILSPGIIEKIEYENKTKDNYRIVVSGDITASVDTGETTKKETLVSGLSLNEDTATIIIRATLDRGQFV